MRLALPGGGIVRVPWTLRIALPAREHLPVIILMAAAFQPLGSFAALGFYVAAACVIALTGPLRGRRFANLGLLMLYFAGTLVILSPLQPVNFALLGFYAFYWMAGMTIYGLLSDRMAASSRTELLILANWILGVDLALNLPSCLIELVRSGIGDWVTGLSGLLLEQSFSQNRSNSVRAMMIVALAAANYRMQGNRLSLASGAFNIAVLILATSMTTVLAAFGAVGAVMLLGRKSKGSFVMIFVLPAFMILANVVNLLMLQTESIFTTIMDINTRWMPKVDFYRQYAAELLVQFPWIALIGAGFGNFMNRFSILANFHNLSSFPGKDVVSWVFHSPLTKDRLVDYYDLENGVVGQSITSIPWSGNMSILTEWGLLGIAVGMVLAWPFLRDLWKSDYGYLVGSGKFLLIFLFLNMFFDCYLDYPELAVPFLVIACMLREFGRPHTDPAGCAGTTG